MAAGAVLGLAISGCGGPPPSAASKSARGNVVRSGTKVLEIVPLPRTDRALAEAVKAGSLVQAGLETMKVQVNEPAEGGQAAAVREAARRQPPAIIVEAPVAPDAELDAAVTEARTKGLFVVALGRPLGEPTAGPGRLVVIAPRPFRASADRLVELAARNATTGQIDPKSGTLLVSRPGADPLVDDRAAALKEALRGAGIEKVDEVAIGDAAPAAAETVAEAVKAHPGVTIVLAADGASLLAAGQALGNLKAERPFVVAGYSDNETSARTQTSIGEYAAAGVYATDRLFRKGVNVVARSLRGDTPADRVEIDTPILESDASTGLARPRELPVGGMREPE